MSDELNAPQNVETQTPTRQQGKVPFVQRRGFQNIALGAAAFGAALGVVERVSHTIDSRAWNDLFLEAVKALLKQNGPWPVILLFIISAFIKLYHDAMKGQIKAKDDEIHRLVQQREILEDRLDVRHSSRDKN